MTTAPGGQKASEGKPRKGTYLEGFNDGQRSMLDQRNEAIAERDAALAREKVLREEVEAWRYKEEIDDGCGRCSEDNDCHEDCMNMVREAAGKVKAARAATDAMDANRGRGEGKKT